MLRNYKGGIKALRDNIELYILEQCRANDLKTSKGSKIVNVIDHPDETMTLELADTEGLADKLIISIEDNPGPEEEIELVRTIKGYYGDRLKAIREEIQTETLIGVQALINKTENQIFLGDLVGKVFKRLSSTSYALVTGYEENGTIHAILFNGDAEKNYNVYSCSLRIDDLGEQTGEMEVPDKLRNDLGHVTFYSDLVKFK